MDLRSNGIRKYPREPLSRESINTGGKKGVGEEGQEEEGEI